MRSLLCASIVLLSLFVASPLHSADPPTRSRAPVKLTEAALRIHKEALLIDGAVTAAGANVALCADIARAGPFGAGHAEPVFAFPAHTIAYAEEVGQAHVRARLRAGDGTMINAIAFRAAGKPLGQALLANRGRNVHAAGTLSIDRWNGEERVQFRLMDLATTEPVA